MSREEPTPPERCEAARRRLERGELARLLRLAALRQQAGANSEKELAEAEEKERAEG